MFLQQQKIKVPNYVFLLIIGILIWALSSYFRQNENNLYAAVTTNEKVIKKGSYSINLPPSFKIHAEMGLSDLLAVSSETEKMILTEMYKDLSTTGFAAEGKFYFGVFMWIKLSDYATREYILKDGARGSVMRSISNMGGVVSYNELSFNKTKLFGNESYIVSGVCALNENLRKVYGQFLINRATQELIGVYVISNDEQDGKNIVATIQEN